jgi:UDP-N-acetylmuramoylalanine--D-glutamate ligase
MLGTGDFFPGTKGIQLDAPACLGDEGQRSIMRKSTGLPWQLEAMRIVVVGAARTGKATAHFLADRGARVLLIDEAPESAFPGLREKMASLGVQVEFGPHREDQFRKADGIVLSPGVPPSLDVIRGVGRRGIPVISELELASWFVGAPIVAITGTNGKTTTTTLVGMIIEQWRRRIFVGGNIGNPLITALTISPPPELVVIEVSSFQLEGTERFHPRVAALLNICEDHLDRHPSMEIYRQAKGRIFSRQGSGDVAVVNLDDPEVVRALPSNPHMEVWGFSSAGAREARAVWRGDEILLNGRATMKTPTGGSVLFGPHVAQNIMAACLCAMAVGCPLEIMQAAIGKFSGLEHRMEYIGELNGVHVINDSKATNVGAVVSALACCKTSVVLIAGGKDKGIDFTPLRGPIQSRARAVVLLGEAAERMERVIAGTVPTHRTRTMGEAIQRALALAKAGDVVLLSPACSSYDQYSDYEERGKDFKAAFRKIASDRKAVWRRRDLGPPEAL